MPKIYFIRHAQASFGKKDYDVLSETGFTQSALLGQYFKKNEVIPNVIFTGTLKRQKQTARTTMEKIFDNPENAPKIKTNSDLNEFSPEFWELAARCLVKQNSVFAATFEKIRDARNKNEQPLKRSFYKATLIILKSWQAGLLTDPDIEPYPEFKKKIIGFYRKLARDLVNDDTVFAFTSGTPISILLGQLIPQKPIHDFEWVARVYNTSWLSIASDFAQNNSKPLLTSINNVTHLKKTNLITLV